MKKLLILSDGRPGHLNQSIAFAKYLNVTYDIVPVKFRSKWAKGVSFVFDRVHFYTDLLHISSPPPDVTYDGVVSAGSDTYYLNKFLSKKLHARSITMMLPRGYRYDFDLIFAQRHDAPPLKENIVQIPANFAYIEPKGIYKTANPSIGIVIGGSNRYFTLTPQKLKAQLDLIIRHYQGYEIAVTTSPRTPKEIERLVKSYGFDYAVIFSENPVNPIADFLEQCSDVFITADSTSMISEAVSWGNANVEILPLEYQGENKFTRFTAFLEKEGYLHICDGTFKPCNRKIDFLRYIPKEVL
ncbi:MAG: ELM1/GtrOC1 family putative glycosyltransferase [Sulfurovum sp.]|nr:ELM1/GtrOC1 family putative glycosyltransferase [Sulfurovum sp.]MDD3499205.1 ELM1/GtrOC1 family putative glycosyltransferase [Sulfurovum sp.]